MKFIQFLQCTASLVFMILLVGAVGLVVDMMIDIYTGHSIIKEFINPLFK